MDHYVTDFKISDPNAVALEDSIMKKGSLTTAGSKILYNFTALFNAGVVDCITDSGMKISGKAKMNEFGICDFFEGEENLSGSTQALLSGTASYCLCNDLFGRYRREAAKNSLYYIHPTYGTVSRYGLIPLAASMDQIGIMCKNLKDGFSLLSKISGNDPNDGAMFPEEEYFYGNNGKKITLRVPLNIINRSDDRTRDAIKSFAGKFSISDESDIEYFDVCKQVMYILSCAEISNNLSRYDGIKFGYRSPDAKNLESLYIKTRTEAFGINTKLTAIMGAAALSAENYTPYYEKAMKIRRLLKNSLNFENYDVIVLPASVKGGVYENLSLYAIANLCGLPSVSFSYNGCGIQLIANVKDESSLLALLLSIR